MKILVEGRKKVKRVRRFECGTCGCIFLADRHEYRDIESATVTGCGIFKTYACICPNCNALVYSSRVEETIEED